MTNPRCRIGNDWYSNWLLVQAVYACLIHHDLRDEAYAFGKSGKDLSTLGDLWRLSQMYVEFI